MPPTSPWGCGDRAIHRSRGAADAGSYSDFAGCCSFLMKSGTPLPVESLAAAHYMARWLDAAVRPRGPKPRAADGRR